VHAADAGADDDAESFAVDLVTAAAEAGVRPRLARGYHRQLAAAVEPAGLHAVHHRRRVDQRRGPDVHRQLLDPLLGHRPHAGASGQQGLPGRRDVASDGRGRAEAGDDDAHLVVGHRIRHPPAR
jgi:hypothetical protein